MTILSDTYSAHTAVFLLFHSYIMSPSLTQSISTHKRLDNIEKKLARQQQETPDSMEKWGLFAARQQIVGLLKQEAISARDLKDSIENIQKSIDGHPDLEFSSAIPADLKDLYAELSAISDRLKTVAKL